MSQAQCSECGKPVVEGRINCPECGATYPDAGDRSFERDPQDQG
jgi:uncharacterized Zn finger protein (UPF0148 family)